MTVISPTTPAISTTRRSGVGVRPWRDLATQTALIGLAALLYFGVRGLTEADVAVAVDHGNDLLRFERTIGLDAESSLQGKIIDHRWLVTAVNWIYIWGHWPAIAGTFIWLHRTSRVEYLQLRNAMFISGAIGLVIFAAYPVAPPRLLGGDLLDTISQYSTSYRVLQPPSLVNKYAALPSLHVGWNLLVGIFIFRHARAPLIRSLGAITPALMVAAVVLTANHYLVDAAAGAAIALTGLAAASALSSRRSSVPSSIRVFTAESSGPTIATIEREAPKTHSNAAPLSRVS